MNNSIAGVMISSLKKRILQRGVASTVTVVITGYATTRILGATGNV
ncbi:hypothetical protein M3661_05585 [Paenibacillus sp. MER 180]|uniref:Uncharacterized protein n=1 Tax=Paenibacillus suaedae TaxID=3077233 RepID=A0AAJ2N359_9BACL|nr:MULTISPECIES: hypothetical protein [unclassified Paenibacillus]MCM3289597.1 hypothetical protein [Paenibacillus sp. MER 180]MDT8975927.1 hypothetical protein [Paenibacillus sp. chi10]